MRTALLACLVVLAACAAPADPSPPDPEVGPAPTPIVPPTGPRDETSREADRLEASETLTSCAGAPGSLYALAPMRLGQTAPFPLCKLAKRVLFIVNVASQCGSTGQYTPMQALHDRYAKQGFAVLGFPSKTFAQELDTDADVSEFCTTQYKITFPMFTIGNVNAPDEQPVYSWLKSQPGQSADIGWNFEKFLIARDGTIAARFLTATEPDAPEVVAAIEAELAKP
ncbi:MAG: glutathione peroxidase [Labilithrix sp.]|nr:glutathione peroxidase [Labilithrix sp.]